MPTPEEITIANRTCRTSGIVGRRAVVPSYVMVNVPKHCTILDYGAGVDAQHTLALRAAGFDKVTAWEFGANLVPGLHDPNALLPVYDVVFASNVLNVQSSKQMLIETLNQINSVVRVGGRFIANYPAKPRKMDMETEELIEIMTSVFRMHPSIVGGTRREPILSVIL